MFDFVESADGAESMPRVYDVSFSFGSARRGLNLADLLPELAIGGEEVAAKNDLQLTDGGGIRSLKVGAGNLSFDYRERQVGGTFAGGSPIWGLAGAAASGRFSAGGLQFAIYSGSMTDEALLETDPALSGSFAPAKLGGVYGFDSSLGIGALRFGGGYMREENTTLGAYSGGLFDFGGGRTAYANAELKLGMFAMKYTRARTETDPRFGFISGMSALDSDAYSLSADCGKWSFNVARPLAIIRGSLSYAQTDYEIAEKEGGLGYDLAANPYARTLNLAPDVRETRIAVAYRPEISERMQMALGFVERINPDNAPGHEEILMMKLRRVW
jgi:hypothetical protein